jgi:hypothetical protein
VTHAEPRAASRSGNIDDLPSINMLFLSVTGGFTTGNRD